MRLHAITFLEILKMYVYGSWNEKGGGGVTQYKLRFHINTCGGMGVIQIIIKYIMLRV